MVELDEEKLCAADRERLAGQREDIATAVRVYRSELDPALFYEQVTPERAKELAARVKALRVDNHLQCGDRPGHQGGEINLLE